MRKWGGDTNIMLYCVCGYTCGTHAALHRHIQKFSGTMSAELHARDFRSPSLCPASANTLPTIPMASKRRFSPLPTRTTTPTVEPCSPTTPAEKSKFVLGLIGSVSNTPVTSPVSSPKGNQAYTLRLLLVRHGQSANKGLAPGQKPSSNPGLTEVGYAQADALGARLVSEFGQAERKKCGDLLLVSSPMRRCLLTILPAVRQLRLNPKYCLCHGGCFEYGCVGTANAGTTFAEIAIEFPEFQPVCFNTKGSWDYRGDSIKENEIECRARATRIVEWCRRDAKKILGVHAAGKAIPTVVLCMHQTISDLLCQLLVDGTSSNWAYGDIKYALHNTGVTEIFLHPDGKATFGVLDDDSHINSFRRRKSRSASTLPRMPRSNLTNTTRHTRSSSKLLCWS